MNIILFLILLITIPIIVFKSEDIFMYINYIYFRLFNNNLKGLQLFLNSVPCINEGGCGLSAYIMYRYMNKKGCVVGYHSKWDCRIFAKNQNVSTSHCYYKYNGMYYDSTGIYTKKQILNSRWQNSSSLYKYREDIIHISVQDPTIWIDNFKHRKILLKLFKI